MLLNTYNLFIKKTCTFCIRVCICFILYFIVISQNCIAFSKNRSEQTIISIRELENLRVSCITQDIKGYIWIGTENGLGKYNGKEIEYYTIANTNNALKSNFISALYSDNNGILWIGTQNGLHTFSYKTGHISFVPLPLNTSKTYQTPFTISGIYKQGNNLWISSWRDDALYYFTYKNGTIIRKGLWELSKDLPYNRLDYGFFKHTNYLYLMGLDGTVLLNTKTFTTLNLPWKAYQIVKDAKNNLWFATNKGLFVKKANNYTYNLIQEYSFPLYSIGYLQKSNSLIIGSQKFGLFEYNLTTKTTTKISKSSQFLVQNDINMLFIDNNDNCWFESCFNGLHILFKDLGNTNTLFTSEDGLSYNNVSSIIQSNNSLLIGTDGKGLNSMNLQTRTISPLVINSDAKKIIKLHNFQNQTLVGTFENEFYSYSTQSNSIQNLYSHIQHMCGKTIWDIIPIPNSQEIVILPFFNPPFIFNPISKKTRPLFIKKTPFSLELISCLVFENDSIIWIGSQNHSGVRRINIHTLENTQFNEFSKNKISNSFIRVLFLDSNKNIWIGTFNGLNKIHIPTNKITTYYSNGLKSIPNNSIYDITEDFNKNIWIATQHGIAKYSKADNTFTQYTKYDGFQSGRFNTRTFYHINNQTLCVGGTNGLNIFNPLQITNVSHKLNLSIEKIICQDSSIVYINSPFIQLPYNKNTFSIVFHALQFRFLEDICYEYKINSNPWIALQSNERISFASLLNDTYTITIKAFLKDQPNNAEYKTIYITIHPPWYKSLYIKIFYCIILLTLCWIILRVIKKQITKKLEILKTKEVYESKLKFFIEISHDIRTPLTLIVSPLQKIITEKTFDFQTKKTLSSIYKNALQLNELITELLDFKKIESGKMQLCASETNIIEIIKNIRNQFIETFSDKNITCTFSHKSREVLLYIDTVKFKKIITNLLSNAIKFTPANHSITISVSSISKNHNNKAQDYIEICVENTGSEIAKEDYENIFTDFYSGKHSQELGSGIGLSIVKQYVEMHYGTISVYSSQNITSFVILLPIGNKHLALHEIAPIEFEKNQLSTPIPHKYSILVVEDNSELCEFIVSCLQSKFCVYSVSNGKQAIEFSKNTQIHCIISDILMPEMNGFDLITHIKNQKKNSLIPFIFLTAKTNEQSQIKALQLGATDYITKPFNEEILISKITNTIQTQISISQISHDILNNFSVTDITKHDTLFIEKIGILIKENINNQSYSIHELSTEMNMSRAHLHRKCKKLFQKSPIEIIWYYRMLKAKELLEANAMNISEIAYEMGFSDPKYFSRRFKNYFGFSPSSLRKKD